MYAQGGKGISEPGAQGFFLLGAVAADSDADGCGIARAAAAEALGTATALGVAAWLDGSGVVTSTWSECAAAGPAGARWREQANAAPLTTTARNSLLPRPCTSQR